MSCGTCCGSCPKAAACCVLRVSFGAALALIGLNHLMDLSGFASMVAAGAGPLTGLATLWGYLVPLLEIVGGVLIAVGKQPLYASWATGLALGSIVVGFPLKSIIGDTNLGDVMPMVHDTMLWIVIYVLIIKMWCCMMEGKGGKCEGCGMGKHECKCS